MTKSRKLLKTTPPETTTPPKRTPLKDVVENPAAHFDSPAAVVTAPDLSDTQKKRVLDAWEEDSRRLTVAAEEGMSGGEFRAWTR